MKFIAGLGNPGRKYAGTRHNVGFLVVERLAERWGIDCSKLQHGALVGSGSIRHEKAVLIQPQTFMNRSGHPTRSVVGFYKAGVEDLLVVHDELDLPFGTVRVKQGGGHGGHNGLRDLHKHFGGGNYVRIRVGIGRPPEGWDTADYVLGKWAPGEKDDLPSVVDLAADAVESILAEGAGAAANRFNVRPGRGRSATSSQVYDSASTTPVAGES
ncbi:MAG: aminoacyl-tRNA hydrolase [Myxococcota bacterium]|nr:aminoacyl-tRNA hydrolase [Myxococcota bacterium]